MPQGSSNFTRELQFSAAQLIIDLVANRRQTIQVAELRCFANSRSRRPISGQIFIGRGQRVRTVNTAFMLMAMYAGRPIISAEDVARDFFGLTTDKFLRKVSEGIIALPLVRMETSQKCAKGIHIHDLAAFLHQSQPLRRRNVSNSRAEADEANRHIHLPVRRPPWPPWSRGPHRLACPAPPGRGSAAGLALS